MFHSAIFSACVCFLGACTQEDRRAAYTGYVEAEFVYIAAPQNGWITEGHIREGDAVAVGDVLFELDNGQQTAIVATAAARAAQANAQLRDIQTGARPAEIKALEAQLAEAESVLVQATAERDRWVPLVEEGNASQARGDEVVAAYKSAAARVEAAREAIEVARLAGRSGAQDAAEAAAESARAQLDEAEWTLSERIVKARVSGRVEDVFHREGEFVSAGSPVVSLLPENALKVRFFVPQDELPRVDVGQTVSVFADGLESPLPARVSYVANEAEFTPPVIYSVASRQKLVFLVEARLVGNQKLRPGLPVNVAPS